MVTFTKKGWAQYTDLEEKDKKAVRKINNLIKSIDRDGPLNGEGKPEQLKNEINTYSRRIDEKNRLVYIASGDKCTIKSCKGHYDD